MILDRRSLFLGSIAAVALTQRVSAAEALSELANRLATADGICALAVATLKRGEPAGTAEASGCGTMPGPDAVFQAASLSKPVVALLALRLAGQGDLPLDAPVSRWFPQGYPHRQNIFSLRETPNIDIVSVDALRAITPRMLLSHTSGFPNWSSSGPLMPEFVPGARWQYSGEGYVLLQRILEAVSGRPLQQLAEEELFKPAELTGMAFKLTDAIKPHLVAGSPRQLRFPYEIAPSSLYTTAASYARFVAKVLGDDKLISAITGSSVPLPGGLNLAWGLGWGLEMRNGPAALWHWGSNPGFRSLVLADIRSRDAIVVLTASDTGMSTAKTLVATAMPGDHPGLSLDLVH